MLLQTVFQLQNCPQHLLCDLPHVQCVTAQRKEGVNTTSEETFPSGDDSKGLHSRRLLVLTALLPLQLFWKHLLLQMVKMLHGPYVQTLSHTCGFAAAQIANSSSKCICKKEDPEMAGQKSRDVTSCVTFSLWSLTQLLTKRTSYAHLTPRWHHGLNLRDFQNFQIFILIYWKAILNSGPGKFVAQKRIKLY